jgi:hypothetical protein
MTDSGFLDWLYEDSGDRRVRERLESQLQDAYSYQAQQSRSLQSQISQVQGSLEQRLNRLTKAFYAFVELSDLRAEMAVFEDEATVRHAAQRLLRSLLRPDAAAGAAPRALPAELPPCPRYWLRPAVASVSASLAGDERAAAAALTEAQELDPARAAVFRVASLTVSGQPALAAPLLRDAIQQPGDKVTYAQRALWRACAHGVYGDAGTELIREWLAGYVRGLSDSAASAEEARWATEASGTFAVSGLPGQLRHGLPHILSRQDALVSPLVAARELGALASWVREAVTGEPADPATATAASTDPVAVLGAVALALTEEGSQDEIALARRARELREIIDDRKTATRPSWDAEENSTLSLLRADAFGPDLPLRRLAIDAGAAWITTLASGLAKSAAAPPPDQLDITVDGHAVQLNASGQASLKAAYAEIEQENAPQNISDKLFGKKHAAEEISWRQERLASGANEAAAAFAGRIAELRAAAQQATADHEAITAALGHA